MAHYIPKISYGGLIQTAISFDIPPKDDDGENYETDKKTTPAQSGLTQTLVNFTEGLRKIKLQGITEAKRTALQTFFLTHAQYGKAFRYYENQNGADYVEYELDPGQKKFEFKRLGIRGENAYSYELQLLLRRVVGVTSAEDFVEATILNGQAVALAIDDLLLDSARYKSCRFFVEIHRKTATNEITANGWLTAIYSENSNAWSIQEEGEFVGGPHGLTFSVESGGQVKYVSDTMAGSNYEGTAIFKDLIPNGETL